MSEKYSRGLTPAGVLSVLTAAAWLLGGQTAAWAAASGTSDALLGEWWTENNEGRVRFTKHRDGTFRGTTTCCKWEKPTADHPNIDANNPNPTLRGRPTVGIVIIWKLVYDDGEYTGGYVYNPRDGKTYRIQAEVIDQNTVKIRGYLGIPLLGQTQIWRRVRVSAPAH